MPKGKYTTHTLCYKERMKVNWEKIKNEYITDSSTSYRKLAVKYEVPEDTLSKRAKKEKWPELRRQFGDKMAAEIQKSVIEDNIEFYKSIQPNIKEATRIIVCRTLETAKAIEADDQYAEKRLNTCQKTIESAVNTIDKICFPQHEQQDNNITVVLGNSEEYAL